ncbi:MAG: DMT family transporter [Alkaliphilus sp.]|nr:DMT family transporter [Alkaliphilus sp.]
MKFDPKIIVSIGVVFVSFSAILTKMSDAPPLIIAAYRLAFTVLLLLPAVIKSKIPEIKNIDKKSFNICMISGVFLALHFATWITSISYTSIASAVVLVNTHPIFIVIASYLLFKEKVSRKAFAGIMIAIVGSIIISTGNSTLGTNVLLGDILALLGAVFIAGYLLIGRVARQKLTVTTYTFLVYLSSLITLLIMVLIAEIPLFPYSGKDLLIFLGLAVFCTLLGHSIFNWALAHVTPTFISTAVLGEPVGAIIWAMIFFAEFPTLWQYAGSGIIMLGIYIYSKYNDVGQKRIKNTEAILENR